MQLISAIASPQSVPSITAALALFGVRRMTVGPLALTGRPHGREQLYRGRRVISDLKSAAKIELLARNDDVADPTQFITTIIEMNDPHGRPLVWTQPVDLLTRVSTRVYGPAAL